MKLIKNLRLVFPGVAIMCCMLFNLACNPTAIKSGANTSDPQWISRQEPNAPVAVVFVHGIFGDTIGTWSGSKTSFFDILKQNNPNVDIFAFGFTSSMFKRGSLAVDEAANLLYARLENEGVLAYPSIFFVNHSMGGLIVMRMLIQRPDVREKTPEIVLFGTPTEGAQITKLASRVINNPALVDMLPADKNTFLRSLDTDFKALSNKPRVWCGYEKIPIAGVMIVPSTSASRLCDSSLAIAANHIDIVKPDRVKHDSFMIVQQALKKLLTPCRNASHGIENYSSSFSVVRTSHWMSGGYDQARWCADVISVLKVEYPDGVFTQLESSESNHNRCAPFNCPEYKYVCSIQVQTGPNYFNKISNACARTNR